MAALLALKVRRWEAQAVLLPEGQGIRITVFGDWFPIRAVEPDLLVGDEMAERVEIARDLRSIRGYFRKTPENGSAIVVRYGDSQEGRLEQPFHARSIRPLPKECQ